jgi:uncharacterized protein YbjT (DUF2867 family)
MHAITGITGQVGGAVARTLLAAGQPVRAVLRDAAKAADWRRQGCEITVAEITDVPALTSAFRGTQAVFVLLPSNFDPSPGFPEVRAIVASVHSALQAARPAKVVCLSTIGAQATQTNLLSQLAVMEERLAGLPMPVSFLRPAWFMENAALDVASARDRGVIQSFLQPLDKPVPMVLQSWSGLRIVELEGPHRVTPDEIAATFAKLLRHPVRAQPVPRADWEKLFKSQGMKNPLPRMQMLDGFNQGWIEFANGEAGSLKGRVGLETVLDSLLGRSRQG